LRTLLKIVYSRPTSKIELTFDNKVVIVFPSNLIGFLKGVDQSEAENIIIKNRGSSLYWPDIDNKITVSALLEAILGISICLE
jgi:inorganic pyrophosphatase